MLLYGVYTGPIVGQLGYGVYFFESSEKANKIIKFLKEYYNIKTNIFKLNFNKNICNNILNFDSLNLSWFDIVYSKLRRGIEVSGIDLIIAPDIEKENLSNTLLLRDGGLLKNENLFLTLLNENLSKNTKVYCLKNLDLLEEILKGRVEIEHSQTRI